MTARTTRRTVTFQHPFLLDGFAREIPAGTFLVETEEELMDTVLSQAWKRALTVIRLPTATGTQDVFVTPEQLNAALLRDRAQQNAASPETAAPPKASSRRSRNLIARFARKT